MLKSFCVVSLLSCGVLSCAIALGQSPAVPLAQPPARAAADAKPILFEVASIRRNTTGNYGGPGPTADGYSIRNMYPIVLIGFAYGVLEFQRIQGLPIWCQYGGEGYDINAKIAESDIPEWKISKMKDFHAALQALLEDRFHLKAHFESRDVPAYALVVAKSGPKFKAAIPGDTYPNGQHDRQGKPVIGMRWNFDSDGVHGHLVSQADTMSSLAQYFSSILGPTVGRMVVDKTGLTGQYDFSMPILVDWTTRQPPEDSEASIFTVIQDSLGLKLVPTKAPVQYLIIDHIERPSEN